jgi:ferric-dicitrate binding protein FerR (iron transport regulator)
MTHPDLGRLTAWVHGFDDAEADAHVGACPECREVVAGLREEARLLSREVANPERLAALKAGLLQQASGKRRPVRGLLWQIPVAAAVLFGLVAVLLLPGDRHKLTDGRVALEDGRVVAAPVELAASESWQIRAVGGARVRMSDRSTVELAAGARISFAPGGGRGVQASLSSGRATFVVAPDARRLIVCSPDGRVEAAGGKFDLKIVAREEGGTPVKNVLAGAIVTVFAGSISLSNANGTIDAQPGQVAVLARAEAPLFLAAPQDKQEELLRRLEQLAARVAKLEDEVASLEKKNAQLKTQLATGTAIWASPGGANGTFRYIQGGAGAGGGAVIIQEGGELKIERKDPNQEKK